MTVEKAPSKKKLPKIESLKKPIIVGGLIAVVAITGIMTGVIIYREPSKGGTLIVGITGDKIRRIDPLIYEDDGEEILICQVTETLFENEYLNGKSQIINHLAKEFVWNSNATELTCFLREGIKFHDGTPFNAQAVKWNFDRVSQVIDPSNPGRYWWGFLFFLPDGRWIINKTQVLDPYTIKFVLNDAFVPFRAFLTHPTTSILSPASTPVKKTLSLQTDKLVGTGPFIYDSYDPNANITLYRNQNYWGIKPKIDKIVLSAFPGNLTTRIENLWNALLTGKIHTLDLDFFVHSNKSINILKNNPEITVQEKPIINYKYVGMDNELINATMRKAISYAINYSSIVKILLNTVTPRSPITNGIIYSNTTAFDIPYYNISKARQILIDAGWPGTENLTADDDISHGNEWEQLVINGKPLATYNLSYYPWHTASKGMSRPCPDNLKQIGVNVTRQFAGTAPCQLYTLGWFYDYNDPHNGVVNDFHSKWNLVNLNDSLLDQWIEDGMREINPIVREQIYFKIQERILEVLYPGVFVASSVSYDVYPSNLKGWQLVPFKTLLKTVYFD